MVAFLLIGFGHFSARFPLIHPKVNQILELEPDTVAGALILDDLLNVHEKVVHWSQALQNLA